MSNCLRNGRAPKAALFDSGTAVCFGSVLQILPQTQLKIMSTQISVFLEILSSLDWSQSFSKQYSKKKTNKIISFLFSLLLLLCRKLSQDETGGTQLHDTAAEESLWISAAELM